MELEGVAQTFPHWFIFLIYIFGNLVIFGLTFYKYNTDTSFYYAKEMSGSLPVARGAAAAINLNASIIMFPVCRNLVSFFRNLCPSRRIKCLTDHNIKAHRMISYLLICWSVVHIVAHYLNIQSFADSWKTGGFKQILANTAVNPVIQPGNLIWSLFNIRAGSTGVALVIILYLIRTSASQNIRRSFFELFLFVHHLFFLFYPLLWYHGTGHAIRKQTNLDVHDPNKCSSKTEEWGMPGSPCANPEFDDFVPSSSGYWMIPGAVAYCIELILRAVHTFNPANVESFRFHDGDVLEIRLKKNAFSLRGNYHEVGQYVQIKVTAVSKLQWHPFTLTSAPEDEFFMIHVRKAGGWTSKVQAIFKASESGLPPPVAIEGPFGTSSVDIFDYDTVICCGAGIGITPFASFLRSLLYINRYRRSIQIKKVYFVWISKSIGSFGWFSELLKHVEQEIDFIEPQIYLTMSSLTSGERVDLQYAHISTDTDPATGLRKWKTNYGRPKWNELFSKFKEDNKGKQIGLFSCGPKPLTNELRSHCDSFSDSITTFKFHKENF